MADLNEEAMPVRQNVRLYKNDYAEFIVTFRNPNGTPMDLTGYSGKADILFPGGNMAGSFTVERLNQTTHPGKVRLSITPNIMPGLYKWDFQLSDPDGKTRTYMYGRVKVYGEVAVGV